MQPDPEFDLNEITDGLGVAVSLGIDFASGYDLRDRRVQEVILRWVRWGLLWFVLIAIPCTDDSDARMRFLGVGSAKAPFAGSDCGFKQYSKQEMRELLTGRHVVRDCSSTHCFVVSH